MTYLSNVPVLFLGGKIPACWGLEMKGRLLWGRQERYLGYGVDGHGVGCG